MWSKSTQKDVISDVLVKLGLRTNSKGKFDGAPRSSLGKSATVRCVGTKATVKLCELNKLITVKEVPAAVNAAMD